MEKGGAIDSSLRHPKALETVQTRAPKENLKWSTIMKLAAVIPMAR